MEYKDLIRFILILIVNIVSGRRLCYYPALHMVKLSRRVRRLLFIVDIGNAEISIVGFVWQVMVVLTTVAFGVTWFFSHFDDFFKWFNLVSVLEWICVGIPLAVYSLISERILKKRGFRGSR